MDLNLNCVALFPKKMASFIPDFVISFKKNHQYLSALYFLNINIIN